ADSNIDRRHQFVASPSFFLPHGFDVASAIRIFSGVPIDPSAGLGDANRDAGGPDRPYFAPGVPFRRNAFRNKAVYFFDAHVAKRFSLTEKMKLSFTVDMFNLFNLQNIQLAGASTTFCTAPPGSSVVPVNCGFNGPTNPNFLQIRDQDVTSA